MAESSTLARPYAKAAFSYALAGKSLESWLEALSNLSYLLQSEKVSQAVTAPGKTAADQVELIRSLLGSESDPSVLNLVSQLAENKRLLLLPEIALQFKAMKQQHEKMCEVSVVSAFENSSEQEKQLEQVLQKTLNSDVSIETSVDNNLIGGVVIRAGDLVIDNSIRGRLAKLNEALGL